MIDTGLSLEKRRELAANIKAGLDEKKPVMLAGLAERHKVSEYDVALALPGELRAFAPAAALEEIWRGLTGWQAATFIMQHLGTVLEVKGVIPPGEHGHGYFNLEHGAAIGGHLKMDDLGAVCFLSLPFMGLESLSLQFFNRQGAVKFSIYAGRENRAIIPAVRESFLKMRSAFCKEEK